MTAKEGNGKAAFEAGRKGGKGTGSGGGKRIKAAAGGRARRVPRNKDMQIRKSSHMPGKKPVAGPFLLSITVPIRLKASLQTPERLLPTLHVAFHLLKALQKVWLGMRMTSSRESRGALACV